MEWEAIFAAEVHYHRGGLGAAGHRQAAAGEHQLGAASVDPPRPEETEPNPPEGYVVCLMRFHERGFGVPVGRFMQALCEYYRLELHNFGPNSISQAAVFVAVCEGYLCNGPGF